MTLTLEDGTGLTVGPAPTSPARRPRSARTRARCRSHRGRPRTAQPTRPNRVALARYYDPTIGRFTATDPLINTSHTASLDAYGYGRGNPVTLSDPTGLDPETAGWVRAKAEANGSCTYSSGAACFSSGAACFERTGLPNTGHTMRGMFPPGGVRPNHRGDPFPNSPRNPEPKPPVVSVPETDDTASMVKVGSCVSFDVFAGIGGSFGGCRITIGGESALTFTPGVGVGTFGASAGGGDVLSNAPSLEAFGGPGICGLMGANSRVGGSGVTCDSIGSNVVTLYAGMQVASRPGREGSLFYATTEVVATRDLYQESAGFLARFAESADALVALFVEGEPPWTG